MKIEETDFNRFRSVTLSYQTEDLKIYLTAKSDDLVPDKYNLQIDLAGGDIGNTSFFETLFTTTYAYETIDEAIKIGEARIYRNFDIVSYKGD